MIIPEIMIDDFDFLGYSQLFMKNFIHLLAWRDKTIGHIKTRGIRKIDKRILKADAIKIMDKEDDLHLL